MAISGFDSKACLTYHAVGSTQSLIKDHELTDYKQVRVDRSEIQRQ